MTRYFGKFGEDLPPPGLYHRILRDIEEPLIGAALAATRGNQIKAAELLGVNRNTLRKKIRDLDIQVIRLSCQQQQSLVDGNCVGPVLRSRGIQWPDQGEQRVCAGPPCGERS